MPLMNILRRIDGLGGSLRYILLSEALTWIGLLTGHICVTWWITQQGGVKDLVLYGSAVAAISLLASPWLSPLGDKFPKQTLRVLALGMFLLESIVLLLLALFWGYYLPGLIVLEGLTFCASLIFIPVSMTQLSEIFPVEHLSDVFGLQKAAQSMGRLLGPALAGSVLALADLKVTLALQCGVLLLAWLLARHVEWHPAASQGRAGRSWGGEIMVGLRAVWAIPIERSWTLINFLATLFLYPTMVMLVPLKINAIGLSSAWYGGCEVALSLGMLASALGGCDFLARRIGRYATRILGAGLLALALAGIGLTHTALVLPFAFALVGFANTTLNLVGMTHRTLARPGPFRSRMAATAGITLELANVISPALAGLALAQGSVGQVFAGFGVSGALLALALALIPGMRHFLSLDHGQVDGWYGKTHPQVFRDDSRRDDSSRDNSSQD